MTQAEYLISRLGGGLTAVGRMLGLRPTVIQGWRDRGAVPGNRLPEIIRAGRALNPPLEHREFFESLDGVPHQFRRAAAESRRTAA